MADPGTVPRGLCDGRCGHEAEGAPQAPVAAHWAAGSEGKGEGERRAVHVGARWGATDRGTLLCSSH